MLRGLTRTPSSIRRPDPSGECAGHSLHAPPTGGGRPYQGCGTGCIRVWYKRDHIAPRISGRSPQSRAAAVHKTTFGGRESVMYGIVGTEAAIARPSDGIRSGECAGHSLHAPPTGGGRPYQGCGTGCIRVWYKRDHIAPRISGRSPQSRAAAVHKTTFGGRESVMYGIVGTEAAIARPSDGIAAATP